MDPGNSDLCRSGHSVDTRLRGRKKQDSSHSVWRGPPKPSTLDFYAIRFSPRLHVAKTDNVVDLHLHGTLPEVLAPQILNLQSGQPRLAPETIPCSEFIESELEITTTYGPQMFVAWLRILSAR